MSTQNAQFWVWHSNKNYTHSSEEAMHSLWGSSWDQTVLLPHGTFILFPLCVIPSMFNWGWLGLIMLCVVRSVAWPSNHWLRHPVVAVTLTQRYLCKKRSQVAHTILGSIWNGSMSVTSPLCQVQTLQAAKWKTLFSLKAPEMTRDALICENQLSLYKGKSELNLLSLLLVYHFARDDLLAA